MAVVVPTKYAIAEKVSFYTPAMDGEALADSLDNSNFLYRDHCPPLIDYCPILTTGNSSYEFRVPVYPSLDGMRYEFWFNTLPSFTGNLNLAITQASSWTGAYSNIVAAANYAVTSGTWKTITVTGSVLASTRVVKLALSGGIHYPAQFLARPYPNSAAVPFVAPYGETASGFRVFEDSLLRTATAPINTEHLDRTKHNARAVVRDRQQCVFSFVQDISRTPPYLAPPSTAWTTKLSEIQGCSRVYLPIPWGDAAWVQLYAAGEVSAGSSTGLLRVWQQDGASVVMNVDATGAVTVQDTESGTGEPARLRVANNGKPILVESTASTAARTTRLHAVVGLWRPGDMA